MSDEKPSKRSKVAVEITEEKVSVLFVASFTEIWKPLASWCDWPTKLKIRHLCKAFVFPIERKHHMELLNAFTRPRPVPEFHRGEPPEDPQAFSLWCKQVKTVHKNAKTIKDVQKRYANGWQKKGFLLWDSSDSLRSIQCPLC